MGPAQVTLNLSQFGDLLSIILSIVALIVTVIGFFASLKFYRDGVALQQLANDALVKIEEKTNAIQLRVDGMFDKTLDAAIANTNREQLATNFDAINEKIEQLPKMLETALGEIQDAGAAEREKVSAVVNTQLSEMRMLVEKTRDSAEEAVADPSPKPSLRRITGNMIIDFLKSCNIWVTYDEISSLLGVNSENQRHLVMYCLAKSLLDGIIEKKIEGETTYYRIRQSAP